MPLRIGFVGPRGFGGGVNRGSFLGTPRSVADAIIASGATLLNCSPPATPIPPLGSRTLWRAQRVLTGVRHRWETDPRCTRALSEMVASQLLEAPGLDGLLAVLDEGRSVAHLESDLPLVYVGDATIPAVVRMGGYSHMRGLSDRALRDGFEMQRQTFSRSRFVVMSSQWAARSVVSDFGVDSQRVRVLPFGPNLSPDDIPSRAEALGRALGYRTRDVLRLLFIGADWVRKGGVCAVDAVRILRARGLRAELTVCGEEPPEQFRHPFVRYVGRFDKAVPRERQALLDLYRSSDIFLLPTKSDCAAMVFCEAAAFGLPAVTANVGGTGEVVRHGVSGFVLPSDADPQAYADAVMELTGDAQRYGQMVAASRDAYEQSLNWGVFGRELVALFAPSTAGLGTARG